MQENKSCDDCMNKLRNTNLNFSMKYQIKIEVNRIEQNRIESNPIQSNPIQYNTIQFYQTNVTYAPVCLYNCIFNHNFAPIKTKIIKKINKKLNNYPRIRIKNVKFKKLNLQNKTIIQL